MQCTVTESWSAISIGHKKFAERNHERVPEEGVSFMVFLLFEEVKKKERKNDDDTQKT